MALATVVTGTVMGAAVLAHFLTGLPTSTFTADPVALLQAPLYVGWVGSLSIMTMAAVAGIALMAAGVLSPRRDELGALLLAIGLFSAYFALDDMFLLHERVLPLYVGIPETWSFIGYALIAAWLARRFGRMVLEHEHGGLLILAVSAFSVSVAFDLVPDHVLLGQNVLEETAELFGIMCWTAFVLRASLDRLRRSDLQPADDSSDRRPSVEAR